MSVMAFAVLLLGATARLTRLVNADRITAPLRARILTWRGMDSGAAYFVTCPWCVSIWVAAVTVPIGLWALHHPDAWLTVPLTVTALVLALSYFTGLLAELTE